MCTSLSVRRRDPLEIGRRQSIWGHQWACVKFIGTNGAIFQRLRVLSGKRASTRNDCLMDFKDRIIGAPAPLTRERYVSDQRRLNLGYLLDPS